VSCASVIESHTSFVFNELMDFFRMVDAAIVKDYDAPRFRVRVGEWKL
jgi:hypothetical protein